MLQRQNEKLHNHVLSYDHLNLYSDTSLRNLSLKSTLVKNASEFNRVHAEHEKIKIRKIKNETNKAK